MKKRKIGNRLLLRGLQSKQFIQTVSLGQSTFTENGEPGYYLIEGDNLANYETIVQIDNMEQDVATYSPSATWLGSIPYVVRTQSLLATNVPGTGYSPKTIIPIMIP